MKKIFVSLALSLLVSGCSTYKNNTPSQLPPTPTNQSTSTTSPEVFENGKPDRVIVRDNHGPFNTILNNNPIKEITRPTTIVFETKDEPESQAVRFFQAGDIYFATLNVPGSMSLNDDFDHPGTHIGIWYAAPWTHGVWQPYIEFSPYDNTDIVENQPFYLWSDRKTINFLAIDARGGGSGEGTAKIFTSEDFGTTWYHRTCFYFNIDKFPELFDQPEQDVTKHIRQRTNFPLYLKNKLSKLNTSERYTYNALRGVFEFTQINKMGRKEISSEPACLNLQTGTGAFRASDFEKNNPLAEAGESTGFDLFINPTEPTYNITLTSRTNPTDDPIITYRRGDSFTNRGDIKLSREFWFRDTSFPRYFIASDINFDGYTDIGVTIPGGAKWGTKQYWIFDPTTKKFISNQLTSDLRNITHNEIKFDTSTKHIITNNFIGPGVYQKTIYGIKNGRIIKLEKFEQEPGYTADSKPTGTCTTITTRLVNGKQQTTREHSDSACAGYNSF